MTSYARITAIALALGLVLTGCTATPADTGKTPDTAPVTEATPHASEEPAAAAKSSRGNLVKEVGELAGTTSIASGVTTSRFALTDIVLDRECTSGFSDPASNGHYLALHLNVETTPELAEEAFDWISITTYDWQAYDADGKRLNDPVGNAWSCLDAAEQLPSQIGPGQSVSGWMVLDVAAPTGFVVLTMGANTTGWEWAY